MGGAEILDLKILTLQEENSALKNGLLSVGFERMEGMLLHTLLDQLVKIQFDLNFKNISLV